MMKQIIKNNSTGIQGENIYFNFYNNSFDQMENLVKSVLSKYVSKNEVADFDFKSQTENNEKREKVF